MLKRIIVLILVLMEYKWNQHPLAYEKLKEKSLNPCFNGIQMELELRVVEECSLFGLNPCFNGIQMERY